MDYATLSNEEGYTVFEFENYRIRFKAPYSLEWDNGYLVVMAKYSHNNEYEEEYIDLNPILENLYIPSNEFLSKIKEVRIQNT